jgi:hypothetical protein
MGKHSFWDIKWNGATRIIAGSIVDSTIDIFPNIELRKGDRLRFIPNYLKAHWKQGEFFFTDSTMCQFEHRRIFPYITKNGVNFNSVIEGKIVEGSIKKEGLLRLYLGNYSQCGEGFWYAPTLAVNDLKMQLFLCRSAEKNFKKVAEVSIDIIPDKTTKLSINLTSPSKNKNNILYISTLDKFENVTADLNTNVHIFSIPLSGKKTLFASGRIKDGLLKIKGYRFPKSNAPSFIYAELENVYEIHSNKIPYCFDFYEDSSHNIYFGETHLHCEGSHNDGMNTPEFVYDYARNVAGMGFCAITDHVGKINDDFWKHQREVAEKYYEPNFFLPILGYEWDSNWQHGHSAVFVKNDLPEIVKANSILELIDKLKKNKIDFITRPNHLNTIAEQLPMWSADKVKAWKNYNWDQHDERTQPLVEIINPRGSSEREEIGNGVLREGHGSSINIALREGVHIGFTGGSDDHTGRPGATPDKNWTIKKENLHSGITAVIAKNLDRDSIWDSLINRHTYATTGAHILVDFRVNNKIMGSKTTVTGMDNAKIAIKAFGTEVISEISIIKNGVSFKTLNLNEKYIEKSIVDNDVSFSIPCFGKNGKHTYYYLRITQCDGHRAWTSPIYFCKQ